MLTGLAALLLLTLLFLPSSGRRVSPFSSYGTDPDGVAGLYRVLDRLGFDVDRRLAPMRDTLAMRAIYVVLEPRVPLTASEVHRLLEAVRLGAGLLAVVSANSRLSDSLGIARAEALAPRQSGQDAPSLLRDIWLRSVLRRRVAEDSLTLWTPPASATIFETVRTERGEEPTRVGLPAGNGRVIIAASADLFRNDEVRAGDGAGAVAAVRLFEWLGAGERGPIVFDEFHHGYGMQPDVLGVTWRTLVGSPAGRMVLQAGVAGLVLLLALGVRPVRPVPRRRIERRSALEHVDALARAYAAVGASGRAATLLARGLRRRHGGWRGRMDEAAYLSALRERYPEVGPEIDRVARALERATDSDAAALGLAVQRIEEAMTR